MIFLSLTLNIYWVSRPFQSTGPVSTIERSKKALERLRILLNSVTPTNAQPWIWFPTSQYPSVPYQPTPLSQENIPRPLAHLSVVPQSVNDEIDRVCQRLNRANTTRGETWCKLFRKCYADTLATTTTLLDDNTTYIITGDIDLMWLRDSRSVSRRQRSPSFISLLARKCINT